MASSGLQKADDNDVHWYQTKIKCHFIVSKHYHDIIGKVFSLKLPPNHICNKPSTTNISIIYDWDYNIMLQPTKLKAIFG